MSRRSTSTRVRTRPSTSSKEAAMSASPDREESAPPVERKRPVPAARAPRRARRRVVVVGGGFAGLQAVRKLARAPVDVTLIDRRNFHLFQPLAYQVATGSLSPAEIASPLRGVLKRQTNARVLLAEVSGFDLAHRRVLTTDVATGEAEAVGYDTLIVAGGSAYSYFGHDEWEQLAPAPKGLEETLEIRRRLLSAFEAAETEQVVARRGRWLTFVVVGGGPTGVEMAGQIAEMARRPRREAGGAARPNGPRASGGVRHRGHHHGSPPRRGAGPAPGSRAGCDAAGPLCGEGRAAKTARA